MIRLTTEGRERLFRPRGTVLRDGQGRADGLALVLEDATDRMRGDEIDAGLLANASRDLDRSLAPLREALESLSAERIGPLNPRQKQRLETIQAESGRLGEVAAHLLAMSSLGESRRRLHPEPIATGGAGRRRRARGRAGFEEERVKLVTDVDPEAPRVLADREKAGLALVSLLRNARSSSSPGGTVTVTARPWEGRVRFAVADTGPGIPEAHLDRIFEPFYQVPGTEDRGDTGFGLTVARNVAEAHGGEIHCESEEGKGSTFWLTLPAAVSNL